MSRSRAVGIDLGTTYSAVAWLQDSGKSAMIANADGDALTPSVVLFDDDDVLVGKEAKKVGVLKSGRFADCVKRDMGSLVYSKPICGEFMPPEVIQAWILKRLKADAVRTLGPDMRVVITVPAFFDEPRRKATADAGVMAALPVLDVVNEPTAAALAFGEELGYLTPTGEAKEPLKVLVYDLGGGTFDVTLLDMRPGDLRTLATDGDVRLGGRDWDMRLADFAAEQFIQEHREDPRENPASLQRLLAEVEEAKRTLSARHHATIRVEHTGSASTIKISRELFEQITADLLERTSYTTRQVLAAAGLAWSDVNRVLLVGGATRMPMVARMLRELSKITPDQRVHPDEAVARGAAIYAGYLMATQPDSLKQPTFAVTNVNSHSLGIEGIDPTTTRKRNVIVIPRNTPLPAKVKERFVTKSENQRSIVVQVLEGESSIPGECTEIGRTVLRDLPPGLPNGWPVEITYEYGSNGRLKVTAVVPGTHREVNLQLERDGSLTDEKVARWKQAVSVGGGFDAFGAMVAEELKALRAGLSYTPVLAAGATAAQVPGAAFKATLISPAPASAVSPQATLVRPGTQSATPLRATAPIPAAPPAQPQGTPPAQGDASQRQAWSSPMAPSQPGAGSSAAPLPLSGAHVPAASIPRRPLLVAAPTSAAPLLTAEANPRTVPSSKAPRRAGGKAAMITTVGFGISAIIGLSIGYYVLCYLNPKGNFLQLPPGWFPFKIEAHEGG
ncbi:MAG TPA: Hsp70 family protein [Pirellulales bacterium]|nr:Hsp70 family protein [Pirellulales bacterium]